jgi:site-specific DNA recombinase
MIHTDPRRAAIYARISSDRHKDDEDEDARALGVKRQEEDCRALIGRLGWDLGGLYVDNDVSAYSGKARPEYARMLDDLRAGTVNAVVAWHPDRIHRSPRELEAFIDLVEDRAVEVQTVTAGVLDLTTPTGRAMARTLGTWARFESEHKAERLRRKHAEKAAAGKPNKSGTRAYGMTEDWSAIVPSEAALIREAVGRVLAGDSLRGIAADWNARELFTTTGGRWQQQPLRRMLLSGRLAGIREHGGEAVAAGTWPAIIDAATLERVRSILRDPARRTTTVRARRYLLSGLLVCGLCGARMVARPRGDHVRRYICAKGPMYNGCGTVIVADGLEAAVSADVVEAIDSPELAEATRSTRAAGAVDTRLALDAIAAGELALEELARDYYGHRRIGRSEYLAGRDAVAADVEAARKSIATDARKGALAAVAGRAGDRWASMSFDQRRAAIGAVVDRVTITAGRRGYNRFDPTRASIVWRD